MAGDFQLPPPSNVTWMLLPPVIPRDGLPGSIATPTAFDGGRRIVQVLPPSADAAARLGPNAANEVDPAATR